MTKKQTDINNFFNEIPGHIWSVISHIISICIFKIPGRIMYLIKCTVTCPDPTTDMFSVLGKSSALSSPEQGDQVTWVFWKDNQSMSIQSLTFMVNDV